MHLQSKIKWLVGSCFLYQKEEEIDKKMTFIYSILQFTLPLTGKRAKNERKTCQSLFTFSHIDLPDFFTLTFLEEKLQFWGLDVQS